MPGKKKSYLPNTGSSFYYSIFDFENDFFEGFSKVKKMAILHFGSSGVLLKNCNF